MAFITSGETFTAGTHGARIESGKGRVLIDGVSTDLGTLHFPSFDAVASLTHTDEEDLVMDASGLSELYIPQFDRTGRGPIFNITYGADPVVQAPPPNPNPNFPQNQLFGGAFFITPQPPPFPVTDTHVLTAQRAELRGRLVGDVTLQNLESTITVVSGINIPSGTILEPIGGSVISVVDFAAANTRSGNMATEGVVDTSSEIRIRSGHGSAIIDGIIVDLDRVNFPFLVPSSTDVEVLSSSIIFY